jgi:hypothetical protein
MAGETTSVARGSQRFGRKLSSVALTANPFTLTYGTTDNQTNDVMEAGYIPAGVTVIGFLVYMTDMETSTTNVRHKITLGSTDLVTAIALGGAGGGDFFVCTPTETTAATLLKVTTTTAAGTGAAGTAYITPLYYST